MNTLRKSERLCSRKQIERLYKDGHGFVCFPYSVRWMFAPNQVVEQSGSVDSPNVMVLVSVSKRRFRKAVDRNRIKRLTRECYRLRKKSLYEQFSKVSLNPILLSLSYIDTKMPDFHQISHKFDMLQERLKKEVRDAQVGKGD